MSKSAAWGIRNFRMYMYAGFLASFAAQVQTVIIGWQVYEVTRDPLYLGFIGLVEAVPALSLALVSGYVVDNSNPLKVFKIIMWLAFFSALLLLVISSPFFNLPEINKLPLLYFAAFLAGVCRGFRMPANTALIPLLVPRDALQVSSAWSASGYTLATSVGPALAGFLYAWKGGIAPYFLDFLIVGIALFVLSSVKIDFKLPEKKISNSKLQDLTAGLRYVLNNQILIGALALDMFAVLFGGAVALLPIFAAEILHVGPTGLGFLRSATSIGAVIASAIMIRFPINKRSGHFLFGSVAGFGLCMIGFGLSESFLLSFFLLLLSGAFDSVSMVIRGTIVQLSAPPEMRGRVGAVNSMFIGTSNQLGEFESGVAASLVGTVPSVVFGGIATLLVVLITALRAPKLRELELSKL